MGLIIGGKSFDVPGLKVVSFADDATLRLGDDDCGHRSTSWVRLIVLHTTMGEVGPLLPGVGPSGGARGTVAAQKADSKTHAGEHLIVDADGVVYCLCDLLYASAYHAESLNDVSIGIEFKQTKVSGSWALYQAQMEAGVLLVDALTRMLSIQRQFHAPYHGEATPVQRLANRKVGGGAGTDCVGICGHRDNTINRGPGDPGEYIFNALAAAGYEKFDYAKGRGEDRDEWGKRQVGAGMSAADADGVAGPKTVKQLLSIGHKYGLWVTRPGD